MGAQAYTQQSLRTLRGQQYVPDAPLAPVEIRGELLFLSLTPRHELPRDGFAPVSYVYRAGEQLFRQSVGAIPPVALSPSELCELTACASIRGRPLSVETFANVRWYHLTESYRLRVSKAPFCNVRTRQFVVAHAENPFYTGWDAVYDKGSPIRAVY